MKNTKRIFACLSILLVFVFCSGAVFAARNNTQLPRVADDANLLSQSDRTKLETEIAAISAQYDFDIVVHTTPDCGMDVEGYAMDYYDYSGYGCGEDKDGILLVVSMAQRDWCVVTTGYGETAITDYGREAIADRFLSYLSDGEYYEAFSIYATTVGDFLAEAKTGEPFDVNHMYVSKDERKAFAGLVSFVGFLAALITVSIMKRKMRTARTKVEARNYVRAGSMQMQQQSDVFLYRNVSRTRRAQQNNSSGGSGGSTHSFGSSGMSHGVSSGKF